MGEGMTVKVQLDDGARLPDRAHAVDAGADLFTPVDFTLSGRSSHTIDTGVHIELPHGYVGLLKSKSGLNVKHSIISEGVVDEGYTGSIRVRLHNLGDEAHRFERGDKITQLLVMPVEYCDFTEVDAVEGGDRADNGFGSTGRR